MWRWPPNSSAPRLKKEYSYTPSEPSRMNITFIYFTRFSSPRLIFKIERDVSANGSVSVLRRKSGAVPAKLCVFRPNSVVCAQLWILGDGHIRDGHEILREIKILQAVTKTYRPSVTLCPAVWYKLVDVSAKGTSLHLQNRRRKLKTELVCSTELYVHLYMNARFVSKQDPIPMRMRRAGDNFGCSVYDNPALAVSQ